MIDLAWYQQPRALSRVRVGSPQHTRNLLQDLTKTWKERKMDEFAIHDMKVRAEARIELLEELKDGLLDAGLEPNEKWVLAFFDLYIESERDAFHLHFGDK
jgi:hypothetical protein